MRLRIWSCLLGIAAAMPFAGLACSSDDSADIVEPPKVTMPDETLVTYTVTGMTCENCENHIREELRKLPHVMQAVASHIKGKAWMIVKGEAPTREAVEDALKAAGASYKLGDAS